MVAAPELSLTLKTWCFPVVGCVGYRGYYDQAAAEALAAELRERRPRRRRLRRAGLLDARRLPTGDWLADPLLNTFIGYPEGELARLIFHELAHQVAFAPGDTLFNESFASSGRAASARERWLAEARGAGRRAPSTSVARGAPRRLPRPDVALPRRARAPLRERAADAAKRAEQGRAARRACAPTTRR